MPISIIHKDFKKMRQGRKFKKDCAFELQHAISEIIGTALHTRLLEQVLFARCLSLAKKSLLRVNRNIQFPKHFLCLRAITAKFLALKKKKITGFSTCLSPKYLLKRDLPKGHL